MFSSAKKFPFYKQLDAMDCGVTCLRMIAKHYGRAYSLEFLREITHLDREGVSLLDISDAAEQIGLNTLAAQANIQRIAKQNIPLPFIAHWRQYHFVVVYQVDKNFIHVANPESSTMKLTYEEFLDGWKINDKNEGIILILEPTTSFYQRDNEDDSAKKSLAFLWMYLARYKWLMVQLVLGLFLVCTIHGVFPFFIESLVDVGIGNLDIQLIYLILGAQLLLFLSRIGVEYIRGWILLHIGTRTNINLISDFLSKIMRLPVRFFDTKMTGDIMRRIGDHERIEHFLTSTALNSLFSTVTLLIFGVILLWYNTLVFGIFAGATILYFVWIWLFLRRRRDLDYKRFDQMSQHQNQLLQIIDGIRDIKQHNAEQQKRWSWERIQAKIFHINLDYLALDQYQRAGASFINEGKNILIAVLCAKAVIDHQMTIGVMMAIQYIIGQLNSPIEQLVSLVLMTQDAKISLERLNEIHTHHIETNPAQQLNVMPDDGDLVFSNVSFRYGNQHTPLVLKNINLTIEKGKKTAIVGTSGSGKTTLVKLALGMYEPTEGNIRLGDVNLKMLQTRLWRSECGVVMQDGVVFSDTIAKNIGLGDEIIDKKRLLMATKVANIHQFIEALPLGYNTRIGSDGIGLSQGQRQRLLIARAIYKNPSYIFFDEATNSLDSYNESIIMDNVEQFFKGKTVISVAHRLSTVKNADKIVVIDEGEIVEQGTHEQLSALRGVYYFLVKNQLELGA
jgi:ATP-binding cassette, subfamily B, bacterial